MYKFILIACTAIIFSACTQHKPKVSDPNAEDFQVFYRRFYSDSTFQLSRIKFPLTGQWATIVDFGEKREFYNRTWTKDNWTMEKAPDYSDRAYTYKISYRLDTVLDQMYVTHTDFSVSKFFVLDKGKWYLTFYTASTTL